MQTTSLPFFTVAENASAYFSTISASASAIFAVTGILAASSAVRP